MTLGELDTSYKRHGMPLTRHVNGTPIAMSTNKYQDTHIGRKRIRLVIREHPKTAGLNRVVAVTAKG